jgi:hypothetical protein
VSVISFAPCRFSSSGTSRSSTSLGGFSAPSFARQLLSSFPSTPLWPFVQRSDVVAILWQRRAVAFLKKGAFFIPIQPLFSHSSRFVVRPSITYFESVTIVSGCDFGTAATAIITATISPTWLDWALPGTHRAWLFGLLWLNHIPLPQVALVFPLFRHALSVYTVHSWHIGFLPILPLLFTGLVERWFGSMKILKHSARSSLHVIDGLKVIFSCLCLANSFLSLWLEVRDRLSCCSLWCPGLSLGRI